MNRIFSHELEGFIAADGSYAPTEFRRAYEQGGEFVLTVEEQRQAKVRSVLNCALVNGFYRFPDATIKRHPDFHAIIRLQDGSRFTYLVALPY